MAATELQVRQDTKLSIDFGYTDEALRALIEEHKAVDPYADYDGAKEALKKLTSMRTGLEAARVEKKADILAAGKAIDAEARRIREVFEGIESPIRAKKDEIDSAEARKEAERVNRLTELVQDVIVSRDDCYGRSIVQLRERLAELEAVVIDDRFEEFIHTATEKRADSLEIVSAAIQREEGEAARRAEQAAEAERLKKERAELEEQRRIDELADRDRREAQKKVDDARQAALDAQKKEQDERQAAIDAEAKRVAAEAKRIQDEKHAAEQAEAARLRVEAMAPDRDKLNRLARDLERFEIPKVKSIEAVAAVTAVSDGLAKLASGLRDMIGESF